MQERIIHPFSNPNEVPTRDTLYTELVRMGFKMLLGTHYLRHEDTEVTALLDEVDGDTHTLRLEAKDRECELTFRTVPEMNAAFRKLLSIRNRIRPVPPNRK